MSPQFRTQGDVIGRDHARAGGASLGPWLHTAEARRLRSEAIAEGTRWIWTNTRRTIADAINDGVPRLTRLVGRFLLEAYARRRRRRIAIARLRTLDDRLLADIGLLRSEIELAVDGRLPHRGGDVPRPVAERRPPPKERWHELADAA